MRHARLLQLNTNEPCCSAEGRGPHVEHARGTLAEEVNVFDVRVGRARSANEFDEVQVSVRKSVGSTFEDCIHQLEQFDLDALCDESE